jgi:hypothetical protein
LNEIQNELTYEIKITIKYVDDIINKVFNQNNNELLSLHININYHLSDDYKLIIAQYLLIKFHYENLLINKLNQDTNLKALIKKLEITKRNLELNCPLGAKIIKNKGPNKIYKKWIHNIEENNTRIKFYNNLNEDTLIRFSTIFNSQIDLNNNLGDAFELRPFGTNLESEYLSFNLLNTKYTLNEIDENHREIIDNLKCIILFDCESKSLMSNFSFEEINKWNSDYNTSFKNYLIITFGTKNQSINNAKKKIEIIRERYKIPINTSYTIFKSEINLLLQRTGNSSPTINFVGFESSSFWEIFVLETSIRELYELRSIKLMNVYSICYNDEIKCYIIDNLFSKKESPELISSSTKMAILELRDDDIETLKEALSNTLELIINSNIKSKIIENLANTPTIIFDEAIIRNVKLLSKITDCLGLTRSIKFKTWSDLLNPSSHYFLILSYRDQGKHPNYYYPNLLEIEFDFNATINAILPNFLFGHHYKWSKYYFYKEYHKCLTHPIRENYFEWNKLKNTIQTLKPEKKLNIDWNFENEYSYTEQRETFKIKLKNQRAKTFNSSDLLIISEIKTSKPKIERVKWFFENENIDGIKYRIQKLDELLDEFNPAERLIDNTQQELDLEIIRKQLGLGNETASRIWKTLLRKKSKLLGIEALYEELKSIFDKNKIPLVSINHFRNSWINIESDSLMPRGNKVFKFLCDYLELNNNYRLILYRLKNATISGKIEATKKYSNLLKDLFADGCFDSNVSVLKILQSRIPYYRNNHSLDELGIDNVNPLNGLTTLIELIQPELKLIELETIEKLSNE